ARWYGQPTWCEAGCWCVGGAAPACRQHVRAGKEPGRNSAGARRAPADRASVGQASGEGRPGLSEESWTGRAEAATEHRRVAAHRARTEAGPGSARIRDQLVDCASRCGFDRAGMWHPVPRWSCLENPAADGLELPAAGRAGAGTERTIHPALEEAALAGA